MVNGLPYPQSSFQTSMAGVSKLGSEDTVLTIAVVGLGPVGLVSLPAFSFYSCMYRTLSDLSDHKSVHVSVSWTCFQRARWYSVF